MQYNEADEDYTRKQLLQCKFIELVANLTTLARTQAHTIASTTLTTHINVPTPAYTAVVTLQLVDEIVQPLREENQLLKEQVAQVSRHYEELASQKSGSIQTLS